MKSYMFNVNDVNNLIVVNFDRKIYRFCKTEKILDKVTFDMIKKNKSITQDRVEPIEETLSDMEEILREEGFKLCGTIGLRN